MLIFLFVVFAAGCGLGGGGGDGDGTPLPGGDGTTTGGGALTKNLGGFVLQAVQGANLKPQAGADVIVNGEKKGKTDSAGRIVDLNGEPGIAAPAEGNVLVEVQSDKATSFQQIVSLVGGSKASVTGVTQVADPENAGTLSKSGLAKPGVKLFGVAADTEFTTSNSQQLAGPPDLRKAANVILKQFDDWKRGFNIKVTPYQSSQNPGHDFPNTLTEGTTTYKLEVVSGAKVELRWSSNPDQNQLVNNRTEWDELGFHLDDNSIAGHNHATTPGVVTPRSANQMGEKSFAAVATWICVSQGGSFDANAGTCTASPAASPGARLGLWYLDFNPDNPGSDKRWIRAAGEAEIGSNVDFKDQSGITTLITHPKAYRPKTNVVIPKPVSFVFVLEDPDAIQATITGKVTNRADNAAVVGALVLDQDGDGQAVTDSNGGYTITKTIELRSPQVTLTAKRDGFFDGACTVNLSQTAPTQTCNFPLDLIPTTAKVKGKVTNSATGGAVSEATVTLTSPIVLDTITYTSGTIDLDDVVQAATGSPIKLSLLPSYSHERHTITVGLDTGATYTYKVAGGPSGLTYPFTIKSGTGANTLTQVEILAAILKKLFCGETCLPPSGPALTDPSIDFLGRYDLKITVVHQGGVTEKANGSIILLNNLFEPTDARNANQRNKLNISGDMVQDRYLFATAVEFNAGAVSVSNPGGDVLRTGVTYTWKMDVTFQGDVAGASVQLISQNVALSTSRLLLYNEVEQAVLKNFKPLVLTDSNCNKGRRILCGVNVVVKVVDSGCTTGEATCEATSTFKMKVGDIPALLQRIQIGDIDFQQNPQPVFAKIEVETDSNGNYAIVELDPDIYNPLNPTVRATKEGFKDSALLSVGTLTAGQTKTVDIQLVSLQKVALPERSPRLPRPV